MIEEGGGQEPETSWRREISRVTLIDSEMGLERQLRGLSEGGEEKKVREAEGRNCCQPVNYTTYCNDHYC